MHLMRQVSELIKEHGSVVSCCAILYNNDQYSTLPGERQAVLLAVLVLHVTGVTNQFCTKYAVTNVVTCEHNHTKVLYVLTDYTW